MLYITTEHVLTKSIERLSAFKGHHGVEEIIEKLRAIESGKFVSEEEISKLRGRLKVIFSEVDITTGRDFVNAAYDAAIKLAMIYPINNEDFATGDRIDSKNAIYTMDGYQFNPESLVKWIMRVLAYIHPYTREQFHRLDQAAIYQACIERGVVDFRDLVTPGGPVLPVEEWRYIAEEIVSRRFSSSSEIATQRAGVEGEQATNALGAAAKGGARICYSTSA